MARIAIGVCGEGRGHAARALTLLERLGDRHEFLVASTDEALALVAARAGAGCRRFSTTSRGRSMTSAPTS